MATTLSRRSFLLAAAATGAAGCHTLTTGRVDAVPNGPWQGTPAPHPGAAPALADLLATLDTTALVVVHQGRLIHQYGDVRKLSYLASARKSLVSMLYGLAARRGQIDLESTLGSIGFD